jgi:hypothetical protein
LWQLLDESASHRHNWTYPLFIPSQQIAACLAAADTLKHSLQKLPSYIFRWGSTGAPHCQGLMSSPDNEDWYERYQPVDKRHIGVITPEFDMEMHRVATRLNMATQPFC